jgi:hypothetical protein
VYVKNKLNELGLTFAIMVGGVGGVWAVALAVCGLIKLIRFCI